MRWNPGYNARIEPEPADDWRNRAACRQEDPELFFPTGNTGPWVHIIDEAKSVCRRCPSMDACLEWALEAGQDHGVWGGLTEDERRAMKRRAARSNIDFGDVDAEIKKRPAPKQTRTIQSLRDEYTVKLQNGHVAWIGAATVKHQQKSYTARQVAFIADRGRLPEGNIHRECAVEGCVAAGHLADARERQERQQTARAAGAV